MAQTKKQVAEWIKANAWTIKPCPFCSKAPKLRPENPNEEGNAWAEIQCKNPHCVTYGTHHTRYGVAVSDGSNVSDERGTTEYMRAAIKRWNNRVILEPKDLEQLIELQKSLQYDATNLVHYGASETMQRHADLLRRVLDAVGGL